MTATQYTMNRAWVSLPEGQLDSFPALAPNGTGILVLPGGGYSVVASGIKGDKTVTLLNDLGYGKQALAAVTSIRSQDRVGKLGIWGYSAGGHVAAMTLTDARAALDFGVLAYPVIGMDPAFTHARARVNLIGADAPADKWSLKGKTSP
ncbi:hypothetical protein Micbo1qcDRAFT_210044 [Microdochium bolleyi]|uniref:Peptidase S9 prolyl oligopeptidase catalytic domain-containing protein n=1 Tax=Microdochium bolleyi TaxID=196109 RepID=A0A136IK92_9PEZI|nr:hypothetical protein Micbo1qcDRAFT_210044 [Microdochium bolleyi]